MRFWANLVGYQLVWFGVVICAARGQPWLSVALAAAFAALQWLFSKQQASDARLLACSVACGIVLDGSLAASGLLQYASPQPSVLAPVWILALWAAFAMTINHSMTFLRGRPLLAAAFGAVGGPLAYLGASRGFDAVAFPDPATPALLALALGWGLAMPALAVFAKRWQDIAPEALPVGAAP
ncbi:MAG: DUF2878 domain-containing protein [Pseudomonadota bacterium]